MTGNLKTKLLYFAILLLFGNLAFGQSQYSNNYNKASLNEIRTAVPFLLINTDIASQGRGGLGVSSTGFYHDAGLFHNPALLVSGSKYLYAKADYIPWLRALLPKINLGYFGLAWGINKNHAVAVDFTYFSWGSITFTGETGEPLGQFKPKEFCISAKYAAKVGRTIQLGIGAKYVNSNITSGKYLTGGAATTVGRSVSADIGLNYRDTTTLYPTGNLQWNVGLSIQNLGSKISYTNNLNKEFLPQNLKLGFTVTLHQKVGQNSYFAFDLGYEANKLLVPTPPEYQIDSNGHKVIAKGHNPDVSVIKGMFQSFGDAPYGSKEEWAEVQHIIGFESRHVINNRFYWALRNGFFYESKWKGGRQYVTVGGGFGVFGASFNIAYLIPTSTLSSHLKNTISMQLSYSIIFGQKVKYFSD